MADISWPVDLRPSGVSFYPQPHVGGSESPITRTRKVYGLSAPRWIAKITLTARGWGYGPAGERGARIDAFVASMEGGLNRVLLWDFRRERPMRDQALLTPPVSTGALAGATQMGIAGFAPMSRAFTAGDYLGGDNRPHLVLADCYADGSGVALPTFTPPLSANVTSGATIPVRQVSGRFQLMSDDAGDNPTGMTQRMAVSLEFHEDLP